jgi:hypothetical protein
MRRFALAGYGSGALSSLVAIDHVAIARLTITTIAAVVETYVSAARGITVFFDLATTVGAA